MRREAAAQLVEPAPIEGTWLDVTHALRREARRCECTGECGENHNWEKQHPPKPCLAMHGATIQRKKDNPSFWSPASTEIAPISYPEFYREKKVDVVLEAVALDGDQSNRARRNLKAMCQRCKQNTEKARDA